MTNVSRIVAVEFAFEARVDAGVSIGLENVQRGFPSVGSQAELIFVMAKGKSARRVER